MENEDFDLYGDLDEALIEPLQEEVQKKQAEELEKQKKDENFREETEKIINELKTSNDQLKKNMSLLLATAKSEIDRKDKQIKDLRLEMDEIIFRKNKGTKKTVEKCTQTEFNESNRSNPSRFNESNKLHDRHKPKEPADSNDRHKRKLSPERRYSDDYRKTSHRDENGHRSKNYDGRSRKLSLENNRSRSPEKHEKRNNKQDLREDDLRKTLLKNKSDDKTSSSNKESIKKTDSSSGRERKDKHKEKDRPKEKNSSKGDEKRDKKKSDKIDSKNVSEKCPDSKNNETAPAQNVKPSIESIIKEILVETPKDIPKTETIIEEKVASLEIVKEEAVELKNNDIAAHIPEKSSSPKKNETPETIIDETAPEDKKLENAEVMSSNLNLSVESDQNKVLISSEKLADKAVKEVKDEKIVTNEKLPEKSEPCKPKVEVPVKTEEPAPKKRKYVPIFEAKIYPTPKDMKNDEMKAQNVPAAKDKDEQHKIDSKFTPIDRINSKAHLPITVSVEKPSDEVQKKEEVYIITEEIIAPITEVMQEMKQEDVDIPAPKKEIDSAPESLNGSFESTKENSLNNSSEKKKHKKRKIITTELESDGSVVWTVTRKKRKIKEQS